jgi:hypothetical protein
MLKSYRRAISALLTVIVAGAGLAVTPVAGASGGRSCHRSAKCHKPHHARRRAAHAARKRTAPAHHTKASTPAKSSKPAPVTAGHPTGPVASGSPVSTPSTNPLIPGSSPAPTAPATSTTTTSTTTTSTTTTSTSPTSTTPTSSTTTSSTTTTPSAPASTSDVGTVTTTAFRYFSPTGVWNTPLLPTATIDPNSAGITGTLEAYINSSLANHTGPWINTTSYSTPIYTVPATQPTVPVIISQNNPYLQAAMAAVPIPADAQPAAGTDAEMTIYQPSTDTLWEMWLASQSLLPPTSESATVGTGGSLAAGTYSYGVTALTPTGETKVSPVHAYTVAAGGKVALKWAGPVGATGYRIYRGPDASHLQLLATVAHVTTQPSDPGCVWTDTGSSAPSAVSPPTANTATTPGQWHASWGGRIQHVSLDPGYYRTISDGAGGYSEQAGWGVTASSLPVAGGLITLSDLAAGQINHAIAVMVPQAAKGIFSFPAQRTDGVSTATNAIPEGARFRLPASLNLAAFNMPPITREIAQAAQTYGLIVNDQTGATVGFRAEDPTPLMRQGQPNPYKTTYFKTSAGVYEDPNFLLASFPWAYLQLVAPGQ